MTMHKVSVLNTQHGVEGHKAGCRDIARTQAREGIFADTPWVLETETKHQVWVDYNIDFLSEGSGAWPIDWKPCADFVPQGEPDDETQWEA